MTDFTGFFPLFLRTGREKARLNFLCEMMCGVSEQNKGQAVVLKEPRPRSPGIKPETVQPVGGPVAPTHTSQGQAFWTCAGTCAGTGLGRAQSIPPCAAALPHLLKPVQALLHLFPLWVWPRAGHSASWSLHFLTCNMGMMRSTSGFC